VVNIGGTIHLAIPLTNGTHKVPLNQWVQIGMTFDGRVGRLYKNGSEVASSQLVPAQDAPQSIDWGQHLAWAVGNGVNGWIGPTIVDNTAYSSEKIAAQYAKAVAQTGPSVSWRFDAPTAPFSNIGTAGALPLSLGAGTGTAVPGQSSPSGLPSVDLNGTKSLTTAATTLGESPAEITVSAWVYVRNPVSGNLIHFVTKNNNVATWGAPWGSLFLGEVSTGLRGWVNIAGTNWQAGSAAVPRNQWAHVAMTFDATKVRAFLNGAQTGEVTVTGAPVKIDWAAHGPWFVGGNAAAGAEFLNGMISDVRIEPRARSPQEIADLYHRGLSGACYFDDACVGTLSCCPERTEESPLRTMCDGKPPERAKISFHLDPWGRQNDYYANSPYTERHNVRWGRMAVNLVGVGVRDCSRAVDPTACYAESFLRYNLTHSGPTWVSDYDGSWVGYGLPVGQVEGGKALAIEEWIDPIVNGWNQSYVSAVQRHELRERPVGGAYELELDVTPDVQLDRIERVQLLMETNYWVRQR
jgi:hypothetical protein